MWLALAMTVLLAQAPPTEVRPLDIEAPRPATPEARERAISQFTRELGAPTKRGRLARWQERVCPAVVGLPRAYGEYIAEAISAEARLVGLDVGDVGCDPNILVLVTPEPERAVRRLREERPAYFALGSKPLVLATGGGGQSFGDFAGTPRAVRWWHVARLTGADGQRLGTIQIPGQPRDVRVPIVQGAGASRLRAQTREDLSRVLLVVDTTRLAGVSYEALGGYLAMAALAQLDPDGDPGALDSILSLFGPAGVDPAAPRALTANDRAYLQGLYRARRDASQLVSQQGSIRSSLREAAVD